MRLALILTLLTASAFAQLANTLPTLPSSSEGTITSCDASGNCTPPVLQPRTFPGTVMDTSFPTQTGATFNVSTVAQLQTALNSAACGDTIIIASTGSSGVLSGPASGSSPLITLPTNKTANGHKWILVESSQLSSLHPFGSRVFASSSEIATYQPFMASITATGSAAVVLLSYGPAGANGCGYYLSGIEMYPSSSSTIVYANRVTAQGGANFQLNDIHGDHFVCDRCYVHGFDDLAFTATACQVTGGVATVTSTNYSQVNDTVTISGFSGGCSFLNGTQTVTGLGSFNSGNITTTQLGFDPTHKSTQYTMSGPPPFTVGETVLVGAQPGTPICGSGCQGGNTGPIPVESISGNTFVAGPIGNGSPCTVNCNPVTVTNMYAREFAKTFTVATGHANIGLTADNGFVFNNQAPNVQGTGARQEISTGFSIYGAQFFGLINSWCSNIHGVGEYHCVNGQAIIPGTAGANGYVKLNNNYFDALGEAVFWGGSNIGGITVATQNPHDIEIRNNLFDWRETTVGYMAAQNNPRLGFPYWVAKDDMEFKNGSNALVTGNIFKSPWAWSGAGDNGMALRFQIRPNQSGNASTVTDIAFVNNFMYNGNQGWNMDGFAPGAHVCEYTDGPTNCKQLGTLQRITIQNNFVGLRPMPTTTTIGAAPNPLNLGYGIGFGSFNISVIHNTFWYPGGASLNFNLGNWLAYGNNSHIAYGINFADITSAPNNPVCRGSGWTAGDVFGIAACTGVTQKVNSVGTSPAGCVLTAATTTTSANPVTACSASQLNTPTNHTCSGCTCHSGACVDFNVDVNLSAATTNYWETDNINFNILAPSSSGNAPYAQALWDLWLSDGVSPNDKLHRMARNYFNVYPPKSITNTPYNPSTLDCGTVVGGVSTPSTINPTATNLSNCEAAATNSATPNGGFAFVTPITGTSGYTPGSDYSLVNPYRAADSTTPAGVDFNSSTGLNQAIATTTTGQNSLTPSVVTTSVPNGAIGEAYSVTFQAIGGTPPYTWTKSWTLPAGITFSAGGVLSGNPTATQPNPFTGTVTATDSLSVASPPQAESLTVNTRLTLTAFTLPTCTVNVPCSITLRWTGGLAPFTFAVTSGSMTVCPTLTNGMCLNSSNGSITGTPVAATTQAFNAQISDPGIQNCTGANSVACQSYSLIVVGQFQYVSPTSIPTMVENVAITPISIVTAGGTGTATCAVASGAFPTGVSLSGCTISGTPALGTSGGYTVVLQVTDVGGTGQVVTSGTLSWSVQTGLAFTSTSCPNGVVNQFYTCTLTASGGITPYTFSIVSGAIPAGTTLTGAVISGIPSTIAVYTFTPQVADSESPAKTAGPPSAFTVTISPAAPTGLNSQMMGSIGVGGNVQIVSH